MKTAHNTPRAAARAGWLACPWSPAAPDSFGAPTGAELRAQRKRQGDKAKEEAAGASDDLRAELRARLAQAARLGWTRPATNCQIRAEVRRFAVGLARRLCDGASMRGRAHVRSSREGYRRKESAPKWWGDFRAQVADEIEAALWHHSGVMLARYGMPPLPGERPGREPIAILRAVRSRFVVIQSLRAGERILRRMSHRTNDEAGEALAGRPDEGAAPERWQPAPEQVARLREAIRAGARNAPIAARMLALLDAILAGRPPKGDHAARAIGRMLAAAAAGGFAEPSSWRAYCGARVGGRPATVTA